MKSRQRNTVKARKGDRLGQRKRETPAESVMIKRETEVRREGKRQTQRNKCGENDSKLSNKTKG